MSSQCFTVVLTESAHLLTLLQSVSIKGRRGQRLRFRRWTASETNPPTNNSPSKAAKTPARGELLKGCGQDVRAFLTVSSLWNELELVTDCFGVDPEYEALVVFDIY